MARKGEGKGRIESRFLIPSPLQQVLGLLLARRLNVIRRPFEIFGQYVLTQQVSEKRKQGAPSVCGTHVSLSMNNRAKLR